MFDVKNKENAYTEVLEILKRINKEDYNKIPKDIIKKFQNEANKEYLFQYDDNKDIEEQNLMEETKVYLAVLFKRYWANEKQKKLLDEYQQKIEEKECQLRREKLFKK